MIRVVGLGEPARGDDGVGPAVALAVRAQAGGDVEVVIARDAAVLVDALLEAERVVLVDAVRADAAPGTLLALTEDRLDGPVTAVSTHATSVPAAVALARALGAVAPLDVVGVVVDVDPTPREGLSDPVRAAVPHAVAAVLRHLA